MFLRSVLYQVLMSLWLVMLGTSLLFGRWIDTNRAWRWGMFWVAGTSWLQRHILKLNYEVRGSQYIAEGPAIYAVKHQSAWETLAFNRILYRPAFVLKEELLKIPFFGHYLARMEMIPINRRAGEKSVRQIVKRALQITGNGRPVVIFPEGTRTLPGERKPYKKRGILALYQSVPVPLIPVALNSGLFWPRNSMIKKPGTVLVEFLPAIPPGLEDGEFIARLTDAIETASDRLREESEAILKNR